MDNSIIVALKNIVVDFDGEPILTGLSLDIHDKEFVTLLGPSGCGKTTTLRVIGGFVEPRSGNVFFAGRDITRLPPYKRQVNTVFQKYALFPHLNVFENVAFGLRLQKLDEKESRSRCLEMLELVGINNVAKRMKQYPHEFSGGMRQRVMIAMGLICHPKLLIADEPTTALDVTIQAQILELMKELQKKTHMGIIFITHNLGVVAEICDKVSVMYAGKIVEQGPVDDIFYKPGHPYTVGLLRSMPRVDAESYERLIPIEGTPVDMLNPPEGCPFAPRCEHAMKICLQKMPPYVELGEGHRSACWLRVQDQLDKAGQEKPVQDQEVSGRE
mgnify:CR=1 FL=1